MSVRLFEGTAKTAQPIETIFCVGNPGISRSKIGYLVFPISALVSTILGFGLPHNIRVCITFIVTMFSLWRCSHCDDVLIVTVLIVTMYVFTVVFGMTVWT